MANDFLAFDVSQRWKIERGVAQDLNKCDIYCYIYDCNGEEYKILKEPISSGWPRETKKSRYNAPKEHRK